MALKNQRLKQKEKGACEDYSGFDRVERAENKLLPKLTEKRRYTDCN